MSGIKTNAALFRRILAETEFIRGEIYTTWLDELLKRSPRSNVAETGSEDAAAIGAAVWQAMQSNGAAAPPPAAEETSSPWKRDARARQLDRTP